MRPPASTLADLAALLESVPPLDEEYRRAVGALLRDQPSLPLSPWDS